ncbi:MAG TPA: glutathione transferase GstA [Alphaproteobacteria bacterium]|nr:glutathione transferase GstA [Alphaproteobacteria bacterium]
MKLYYSPGACSHAPHILLREAGLNFSLEKVDLGARKTESGADFTKINPNGYVPALQLDNGEVITEGPAIDQFIADQVPAKGLAPANGTPARYKMQSWLNFISTELHKQFGPLFAKTTPDEYKKVLIDKIKGRFDTINAHLAKNSFLMGDSFTAPDAYLYTVVGWAKYFDIGLDKWPALKSFMDRVAARPSAQAAAKAEGLA